VDPSIVPNGVDQTAYLVLNDFGRLDRAYCETSEARTNLETLINDLISAQYDNPVRVVAFNTSERWSEDVSQTVARELIRRAGIGDELSSSIADFVERHLGPERQRELAKESTASKLLARKQQLLNRLSENPGPQERAEIEGVLAQINAALNTLEEAGETADEQ
jgi:hypothetical protein